MDLPDLTKYSILELYSAGMRFVGDYDEDAAVEQYLALHPGAQESVVRAELQSALANLA